MTAPARSLQRGAAIVAALLTVALVTGLSVASFWRQWRSIEVETAQRQRLQALWLSTGALDWAQAILADDGVRSAGLDHLGEAWARPVHEAMLQDFLARAGLSAPPRAGAQGAARLGLRITDAQGQLNLLNLLQGQSLSPTWLAVFGRLFDHLGLPPTELDRLGQALRRASVATATSPAPTDAAAALMPLHPSDLSWLGLAPDTVQTLSPHVSLLPGLLPVNVNTASAPVLQAVLDLGRSEVQALIAQRQSRPFTSLASTGLKSPDPQMLAIGSYFFEVQITLQLDPAVPVLRQQHALLQREGPKVRTLWLHHSLPAHIPTPSGSLTNEEGTR